MKSLQPVRRQFLGTLLLTAITATPAAAVLRRGSKVYPDKETTADMSGMNRIFIGWVDMKEDNWAMHGYTTKPEWAAHIMGLNGTFISLCQSKLVGKTVTGAKDKSDENASGSDLYVKFTDVVVDYDKYHLIFAVHFIDPKTGSEIGSLPARPYFGNDWGLVNYLKAALDEASQKIKVEVVGADAKKKRKIPLIGK